MVKHKNFKTQTMILTKFSVGSKALFPFIYFFFFAALWLYERQQEKLDSVALR